MSNTYKLGQWVKVSAAFADEYGVAFDPTTVIAMVKKPGGTETSYTFGTDSEVIQEGADDSPSVPIVGSYYMWVATDQAGDWSYRWKGDDVVDVANEDFFNVEASRFTTP